MVDRRNVDNGNDDESQREHMVEMLTEAFQASESAMLKDAEQYASMSGMEGIAVYTQGHTKVFEVDRSGPRPLYRLLPAGGEVLPDMAAGGRVRYSAMHFNVADGEVRPKRAVHQTFDGTEQFVRDGLRAMAEFATGDGEYPRPCDDSTGSSSQLVYAAM